MLDVLSDVCRACGVFGVDLGLAMGLCLGIPLGVGLGLAVAEIIRRKNR